MKEKNLILNYVKNGEIDLETMVKDYTPYIDKIISNMNYANLNMEDKEEIISDVFFIIWKNKVKLEKDKLLSPYIAGITKNLVKEKLRKRNISVDTIESYEEFGSEDEVEILDDKMEKIKLIEKKLSKMKFVDREIFKSFYYNSKSIKDIAKEFKISEANVKTRLYRIRNKIKRG